jgi:hypothetical protein
MAPRFITPLLLISLVLLSGCVMETGLGGTGQVQQNIIGYENIGGRYNLTLIDTQVIAGGASSTMKKIRYELEGEVIEPDQMLPDSMRPGLDWLKANTPEDAVVMSWWDYGHAIRAYSEREPVVDSPSKESLVTTVAKHLGKDPSEMDCPTCVPHDLLQDVARLLLAEDTMEAAGLMGKYGADYLYVHDDDESKSVALFIVLGEDQSDISSTVLGKALALERIDGFELVHYDEVSRIYSLEQ